MKKQTIFYTRRFFVGAVLHLACMAAVAEVVVVVSAKSTVTTLTAEQVTGIFMGKSKSFPDGSPAVAIDQTESSPIRIEFTSKVLGKDEAQLSSNHIGRALCLPARVHHQKNMPVAPLSKAVWPLTQNLSVISKNLRWTRVSE